MIDLWIRNVTSRGPTASDPAQNPYWKRDVRRAYPQLSVVTQSELSTLLIQHSTAPAYVYHIKFILPPRMLKQLSSPYSTSFVRPLLNIASQSSDIQYAHDVVHSAPYFIRHTPP